MHPPPGSHHMLLPSTAAILQSASPHCGLSPPTVHSIWQPGGFPVSAHPRVKAASAARRIGRSMAPEAEGAPPQFVDDGAQRELQRSSRRPWRRDLLAGRCLLRRSPAQFAPHVPEHRAAQCPPRASSRSSSSSPSPRHALRTPPAPRRLALAPMGVVTILAMIAVALWRFAAALRRRDDERLVSVQGKAEERTGALVVAGDAA